MGSLRVDQTEVKVAVIGGGPVGALQTCFLAKRGFLVDLYEAREDIRTAQETNGRSINLSLSSRGRLALKFIGIDEEVMEEGIPMCARGIHDKSNTFRIQPYDINGQEIVSVNRSGLNKTLLTHAEKFANVKIYFSHKLTRADLNEGNLFFTTSDGNTVSDTYDVVFGTDGAYSTMREQLMRVTNINFSQEYIPHGYMEFIFPANESGSHALPTKYLHIWPRDEFVMLALPNKNHTFTGTLFMPVEKFAALHKLGAGGVNKFFKQHFEDALDIIGEETLQNVVFPPEGLSMISIKCYPYHYKNKAVLLGDAAHAMVPFYGQGVNCGFEDCLVLNNILDKHDNNFGTALSEFSRIRSPDAQAMCDLSMYNYTELSRHVNSRWFRIRTYLTNVIFRLFPRHFMPLYNMVAFSSLRYSIVMEKWQRQKVLGRFCRNVMLTTLTIITSMVVWNRFFMPQHYGVVNAWD